MSEVWGECARFEAWVGPVLQRRRAAPGGYSLEFAGRRESRMEVHFCHRMRAIFARQEE